MKRLDEISEFLARGVAKNTELRIKYNEPGPIEISKNITMDEISHAIKSLGFSSVITFVKEYGIAGATRVIARKFGVDEIGEEGIKNRLNVMQARERIYKKPFFESTSKM